LIAYGQSNSKSIAWYQYGNQKELDDSPNERKESLQIEIDLDQIRSIKTWGLEKKKGYLGKLINFHDQDFSVINQDKSLIMVMEAQIGRNWFPIEFWGVSDCGQSYTFPLELKSKSYVEFDVPIHEGDYETQLRLKLFTGLEFLYSRPFKGVIYLEKLEKTTDSEKIKYEYLDGLELNELGAIMNIYKSVVLKN
jgi:hypothetical protein